MSKEEFEIIDRITDTLDLESVTVFGKERKLGKSRLRLWMIDGDVGSFCQKIAPIMGTRHGVTHFEWSRSLITRHFPLLRDRIILQLSLDNTPRGVFEHDVTAAREDLCDGAFKTRLLEKLDQWISGNKKLKEHQEALQKKELEQDVRKGRTRKSHLAAAKSILRKLGLGPLRLGPGIFSPTKPPIEEHDPPTYISWSLPVKEFQFEKGQRRYLQFETDAPEDFYLPYANGSRITLTVTPPWKIIQYGGIGLWKSTDRHSLSEGHKGWYEGFNYRALFRRESHCNLALCLCEEEEKGDPPDPIGIYEPKFSSTEDPSAPVFQWYVSDKEQRFYVRWNRTFKPFKAHRLRCEKSDKNLAERFEGLYEYILFYYCACDCGQEKSNKLTVTAPENSFDPDIERQVEYTREAIAHAACLKAITQLNEEFKKAKKTIG